MGIEASKCYARERAGRIDCAPWASLGASWEAESAPFLDVKDMGGRWERRREQ